MYRIYSYMTGGAVDRTPAEKLAQVLKEFSTTTKLRIIESEAVNNTHQSVSLYNRLEPDFPKLAKANKVAGLLLQKVANYVFNTKPAPKLAESMFFPLTKIFLFLYPNIQTRQRIYMALRTVLKNKYGASSVIYKNSKKDLAITYTEFQTVSSNQEQKRDSNNQNKKQFEFQTIIDIMQRLRASSKFEDEVILASLAVGSRFIEILRESTFEPVLGNPYQVQIVNVAKKRRARQGNEEGEQYTFIKPIVLLRYDELNHIINDLRKLSLDDGGEEMKSAKLTARFIGRTNKRIKELGIAGTTHDLRKLYGALSYEFWADTRSITLNEWLKAVLGHSQTETSLHYTNVHLNKSSEPIREQISEVKSEVKQLGERIAEIELPEKYPEKSDENYAEFKTTKGLVYIKKLAHQRQGEDKKLAEIAIKAKEMERTGVKVNTYTLRKIGVGARYAAAYMELE